VTTATAGRAIDLLIERPAHLEAAIIEVWNWITDVGAGPRSLDEKVEGVRRRRPGWTVTGAWVLRGTRRNRALVGELGPLFRARFPGSSTEWLRAFDDTGAALPSQAGLLWTDAGGTRLWPSRLIRTRSSREPAP
jgi:hypothetical protein